MAVAPMVAAAEACEGGGDCMGSASSDFPFRCRNRTAWRVVRGGDGRETEVKSGAFCEWGMWGTAHLLIQPLPE